MCAAGKVLNILLHQKLWPHYPDILDFYATFKMLHLAANLFPPTPTQQIHIWTQMNE